MEASEVKTKCQVEQLLEKALIIIELTNDLKEKSHIGEKYACDLKSLAWKACQITSAIQKSTGDFLQLAEHIIKSALEIISTDRIEENAKEESTNESSAGNELVKGATKNMDLIYNELINLQKILKKDIHLCEKSSDMKLCKTKSSTSVGDMIKTLQTKQLKRNKVSSNTRLCTDEIYPEITSKESLLDQANLSLQTVHEDGFTDFKNSSPQTHQQTTGRSLRSIQRIKRILKKEGVFERDTDSTEEDLVTKSSVELIQSYSINSMGQRDSETDVLRNNASGVNILLHNISEED